MGMLSHFRGGSVGASMSHSERSLHSDGNIGRELSVRQSCLLWLLVGLIFTFLVVYYLIISRMQAYLRKHRF